MVDEVEPERYGFSIFTKEFLESDLRNLQCLLNRDTSSSRSILRVQPPLAKALVS